MTILIFSIIFIVSLVVINKWSRAANNINSKVTNNNQTEIKQLVLAERVVKDYSVALSISPNGIARSISILKNSKMEIKNAFKDYVLGLRDRNKMTDEIYSALKNAYQALNQFVDDDVAEVVNRVQSQLKKRQETDPKETQIYYDFCDAMMLGENLDELIGS